MEKLKKSVILVGGGKSIKEGIELGLWERIKENEIWSLNYAFLTMPYTPKREVWVDGDFFRRNIVELQELHESGCEMVTRHQPRLYDNFEEIKRYQSTRIREKYWGKKAIEKNEIYRGQGGFVGTYALSLAISEGYDLIYLLGYDYGVKSLEDKFTHYYQEYLKPKSVGGVGHPEVYLDKHGKVHNHVADYEVFLKEEDVKIINVSPNSNIPYFKKINYEQFFNTLEAKNE